MRFKASIATSIIFTIHLSGCVVSGQPDESTSHQSVLTNCSSLLPMSAYSSIPIDRDKELIIRNISVVDDPCRTAWNGTGCTSTLGKWTFGQLMATMSGNSDVTSPTARNFVSQWLQFWLSPQTNVNPARPQTVAVRPNIGSVLLWRWLQASGCSSPTLPPQNTSNPATWLTALQNCPGLDLKVAPFRLLAISNRIDLDGRDYSGNGAPGELRFAFGFFNTSTPTAPSGNAEVILEYHFPNTFPASWWASMFHNMSNVAFGPSFASQLQSITDLVVGPNAQPGGPNNGSSIGQIRTDENVFDPTPSASAKQWEFRQFALPCTTGSCLLAQVPVSQTPPTTDNTTPALTTFLTDNQVAISNSSHVVPASMLGGSSLSPQPAIGPTVWNTTGDDFNGHTLVNPSDRLSSFTVRHNFAFSTCVGCHYLETANTIAKLFHINPRAPGAESPLSPFLNTTPSTDPAIDANNKLSVLDPNGEYFDLTNQTAITFEYNEIWRRACEIRRIFAGFSVPFSTTTGHH